MLGDSNILILEQDEGFILLRAYLIMKFTAYVKTTSGKSKGYKFNLKALCGKLELNYTTAKQKWIAALKKSGFQIEKERNDGNYTILDIVYPRDIDFIVSKYSEDTGLLGSLGKNARLKLINDAKIAGFQGSWLRDEQFKSIIENTVTAKQIDGKLIMLIRHNEDFATRIVALLTIVGEFNRVENNCFDYWDSIVTPYTKNGNKDWGSK
jgi:hypothetical protein